MSRPFVVAVDPSYISAVVRAPEEDDESGRPIRPPPIPLQELHEYLDRLPPIEQDFIELVLFGKKTESDVAEMFGYTQAAVSYRIHRAYRRIRFMAALPKITSEDLEELLAPLVCTRPLICSYKSSAAKSSAAKSACTHLEPRIDELAVKILVMFWETSGQSTTAKKLGVTQGLVRHRLLTSRQRLRAELPHRPELGPIVTWLDAFGKGRGWNILRESGNAGEHQPLRMARLARLQRGTQ